MSIVSAIRRGDTLEAARIATERFGVIVPPAVIPPLREQYAGWMDPKHDDYNESTWLCWFKNRVDFPVGGESEVNRIELRVALHIGFLSLEESADMLYRLGSKEAAKAYAYEVARSKIFSTPLVPRPIDETAQRVAPSPAHKEP